MNNAREILERVEFWMSEIERRKGENCYWDNKVPRVRILEVCDDLNIFDWWKSELTLTDLKDMRKFLREAIKLGYTGYVCFKVGLSGCANGMWAHKKETDKCCSPDGECLYKSFTPEYNYWSICDEDEVWYPRNNHNIVGLLGATEENSGIIDPDDLMYNELTTIKKLEDYIVEHFGREVK